MMLPVMLAVSAVLPLSCSLLEMQVPVEGGEIVIKNDSSIDIVVIVFLDKDNVDDSNYADDTPAGAVSVRSLSSATVSVNKNGYYYAVAYTATRPSEQHMVTSKYQIFQKNSQTIHFL
jgi:hypothetical protein